MDEAAYETPVPSTAYTTLPPSEVLSRLLSGWTPYVVDVRIPEEVAICSLPFTDAVVPHRRLSELDLPVNRDVLVFCKGGVRSAKACRKAAEEWGRGRIFEIGGGIMGWREEVREGGRTNGPTRLSVNTRRCKC